jgi:DNA-binding CsgD family transcriptional regulator
VPGAAAIDLRGLDDAGVAQLVDAAVGGRAPAAVARAVGRSTGGNPLFVREVARHLVEGQRLVERGGRWSSDFSAGELGIPATVRLIVGERLAALSPAAQLLLPVAALAGPAFDVDPAASVAGVRPDEALAAVDEALASGLIEASGDDRAPYRFSHAIVRDAVGDTLNPSRRRQVHRRLAEALAAGARDETIAMAEHLWAGRRPDGADDEATVEALLAAARLTAARSAPAQAVELLDRALSVVGAGTAAHGELLATKAVVAADALDATTAAGACRQALGVLAPAEAGMLVVRVVSALREGTPRAQWEPLVQAGLGLLGGRRGGLAWARLAVMIDPLEPVLTGPVYAARWTAYPPEAVALLSASAVELDQALAVEPFAPRSPAGTDRLLAQAQGWADPAARRRGLDLAARDLALRHGRVVEARRCYEDLLAVGEASGSLPARAEAHAFLALCTALLGDLPAAGAHVDELGALVVDLWPTHRMHVIATYMETIVSYVRGEGDWDRLGDALARFVRVPAAATPFAAVALALGAVAFAMGGRDADAGEMLDHTAEALRRHQPYDHGFPGTLWFATAAAHRLGSRRHAAALEPALARQLADGTALGPCPSPAHVAARLAAVAGRSGEAAGAFAQARDDYAGTGHLAVAALVDAEEAALGGAGAAELRDRAQAAFAELAMTGWAASSAPAPARRSPLSPREDQVLRLLAAGLTNKEIAARLTLSLLTVNRHVANIYLKLGTRNRAEATAWALGGGRPT